MLVKNIRCLGESVNIQTRGAWAMFSKMKNQTVNNSHNFEGNTLVYSACLLWPIGSCLCSLLSLSELGLTMNHEVSWNKTVELSIYLDDF